MTIKEVEEKTGLARSSIRYYEKEDLIHPDRDNTNGYRNYTEEDIRHIRKIAYLRTLGISIENIQQVMNHKTELRAVIEKQAEVLGGQAAELEKSRSICEKMLEETELTYDCLDIEAYVPEVEEHWESNRSIFQMDSVSFLYLWGGTLAWSLITALCFLTALIAYPFLPEQIPVQWHAGEVSAEVGKAFIFVYPSVCVAMRLFLRPFIWRWLKIRFNCQDVVSDYVTNYACFVALSVEIFTILFVYCLVKNVTIILFADTVVLIGLLLLGYRRQ